MKKYSAEDFRQLEEDSRGVRAVLLFLILALIVAVSVYVAVTYWKVPVAVEPEVMQESRETMPE